MANLSLINTEPKSSQFGMCYQGGERIFNLLSWRLCQEQGRGECNCKTENLCERLLNGPHQGKDLCSLVSGKRQGL